MFDEKRECVFKKIIGTLLKRNSFKGIPETLVSFLEFFGEGFVRIVCSRGHIDGDTER